MTFIASLLLMSTLAHSAPVIERAGQGCPDSFCVWMVGKDFGSDAVARVFTSNGQLLNTYSTKRMNAELQPDGNQVLSFALATPEEMDTFENFGIQLEVHKTETDEKSARFFVRREGPLSPQVPRSISKLPLEIGGTNYVTYDFGDYIQDNSLWGDPVRGVKMVLARYHENPRLVKQQIKEIKMRGQQKISLVLWWVEQPNAANGVFMHTVDISQGRLRPQHEQNMRSVLAEIRAAGFNTVTLRYGPQGGMEPAGWTSWDERRYQLAWGTVQQTHQIMKEAFAGSNTKLIFDLSGEMGGLTHGQQAQYTKRLWTDFVNKYGKYETYGFSIAYYPGRIKEMVQNLETANKGRPDSYAVDLYPSTSMAGMLYKVAKELKEIGELHKPIIIQETWYNDAENMRDIVWARNNLGLNILHVNQWQLTREGANNGAKHFDAPDASLYYGYTGKTNFPSIHWGRAVSSDYKNILLVGEELSKYSIVKVYDGQGRDQLLGIYGVDDFVFNRYYFPSAVTITLTSEAELESFLVDGLWIEIENPNGARSYRKWISSSLAKPLTPKSK